MKAPKNNRARASKMIHIDLLRPISEMAIILKTDEWVLRKSFKAGTLPFVAQEVGNEIVCYIPAYAVRSLRNAEEAGVTKILKFYKYIYSNRLSRLMNEDFDWRVYDLRDFK